MEPRQGGGSQDDRQEADLPPPPERPRTVAAVQLAALATLVALAAIDAVAHDFEVDRDWLGALIAIMAGAEISHRWTRD